MIKIGEKTVGEDSQTFITFEAGPTHDGVETAIKLVEVAAEARADAIKFQIVDADRLVADKKQLFGYEILSERLNGKTESKSEPLYDILKRRALSRAEWRMVKDRADELGLAFFATVAFDDEVEFVSDLGCQSIKIASGDVNHLPLIRSAARTGLCIQLDTGNSTIGEIETAVEVIEAQENNGIIIHHCPSGYPARINSINLNIIKTLVATFSYPIAFSDHTPGWDMDIAAIALGAGLVEKTITLDRRTPSVEHMFSLEPRESKEFVAAVRQLEIALGSSRRMMSKEEKEQRNAVRRSPYLINQATQGTRIKDLEITFSRPGSGLTPDEFDELCALEAILARNLPAGHALSHVDLQVADKQP